MILAVTFIIGALVTYWSIASASVRGGSSRLSIGYVSVAMTVSAILSGMVYATGAAWAVLADFGVDLDRQCPL